MSPSGSTPPRVPATGPVITPLSWTGARVGAWLKDVRRIANNDACNCAVFSSETDNESTRAWF